MAGQLNHTKRRRAHNSTLAAPDKPMERRTPLSPVNRERRKRRWDEAFGDKSTWLRQHNCVVCGRTPCDPHHVRSRGAGGKSADTLPLCRDHHTECHQIGRKTFEERHDIDLELEACEWESRWQAHQSGKTDLGF